MQGTKLQDAPGDNWTPQSPPADFSDAIFARRLRAVREVAGVTQQQVADAMARVDAQIAVRALSHQAAEYRRLLEEQQLLYDNTVDRLNAARRRLDELGGPLPFVAGSDPHMEQSLAALSIPLSPGTEEK